VAGGASYSIITAEAGVKKESMTKVGSRFIVGHCIARVGG
jgi:hypothetical protein